MHLLDVIIYYLTSKKMYIILLLLMIMKKVIRYNIVMQSKRKLINICVERFNKMYRLKKS